MPRFLAFGHSSAAWIENKGSLGGDAGTRDGECPVGTVVSGTGS